MFYHSGFPRLLKIRKEERMNKKIVLILFVPLLMLIGCKRETVVVSSISKIELLPQDATIEDMVMAFEEDYARAAQQAGIAPKHGILEYEESAEMATVQLTEDIEIMISPPSEYHRVWYVGVPESVEWMKEEAQLVLMASDDTLSSEEAQTMIDEIFEEAWNNRNKMPSAVWHSTPSKINYSLSIDDWWRVSFFVSHTVYK